MKTYKAGELLKISLGYEKDTLKLYKSWAKNFSREPDVATFWRDYAEDETIHVRLLKELRARLSRAQLETQIECEIAGDTRRLLLFLQKEYKVEDIEQALQYAKELENTEINPLFIVIMSFFEKDEEAKVLLRTLLDKHINKPIRNFPQRFSNSEQRREIKV